MSVVDLSSVSDVVYSGSDRVCKRERNRGKREREYVSCEEGKESDCEGEREGVREIEGMIYSGGLTGSVA